jgi:hypothetical protein
MILKRADALTVAKESKEILNKEAKRLIFC